MTVYVTDFVKSLAVEPLNWVIEPTLTFAFAEAVKVATNFETSVPYGTFTVIVVSFIVASIVVLNPVNPNAVIAFSVFLAIVNVTEYVCVVPFSAVTT